jgi:hypothetical protein
MKWRKTYHALKGHDTIELEYITRSDEYSLLVKRVAHYILGKRASII